MGHKPAENTDNGNALLKLGYIDSGPQERTVDTVLIEPVLGKSNNPFILLRNVNNVNNLFD
jgi:hypothetical protein